MANGIKIGNLDISSCKVGSDDCKVYLGDILLYSGGTQPQTLQWVTFSNGDTIPSDLQIYGIKGIVNDLSLVFNGYSENIYVENAGKNKYNAIFGGYADGCYNEGDIVSNTSVEYTFSNIGCSDSYTVSSKTIANMSNDIQLLIDEASSRLPQGYTEVEYIENTGTSYINTDLQIYSSTTNSFEVEAKLIASKHDSSTYQNVFSCMSEDGEPYQGFTYRYQLNNLDSTSIPNGQNTFTIVNNEDSTQTVTVTSSTSQRTYTHTYPLTLFCGLNSSRNPFRWTNSKFYYCKVKMNDELVRDLVPCKRDSDDKYGMYDMVSKTFLTSPNNANFVGGNPV